MLCQILTSTVSGMHIHDLLLDQPCFFLAPHPRFLFSAKIALNIPSYPTFATNNQILVTQIVLCPG